MIINERINVGYDFDKDDLSGMVKDVISILKELQVKYGPDLVMELNSDDDDCLTVDFSIKREEFAYEAQKRIASEEHTKSIRREYELRQLAVLKAKYPEVG